MTECIALMYMLLSDLSKIGASENRLKEFPPSLLIARPENAKNFATYLTVPDLNHFAMEGLSFPRSNKDN